MAQRSATPPLAQCRDGTVYLVLDDFGELGRAYRVSEGPPEPTPMATPLYAASSTATQAARRLKGAAHPDTRPGGDPFLVRRRISVA
jgi:hypothetical protein